MRIKGDMRAPNIIPIPPIIPSDMNACFLLVAITARSFLSKRDQFQPGTTRVL
jgi:hypothetical protein